MTIRRILIPLDGSELSEQALALGTRIARRSFASIHLLSVVPDPLVLEPGGLAVVSAQIARARLGVEQYVERTIPRVAELTGGSVTGEVALGEPVASILEVARRSGADLIVMTSHGRSGFSRFWTGSAADALMRRSTVPVLVVKPTALAAEVDANVPQILVPLDGTPLSEIALRPAETMAKLLGARVTLQLVLENPLGLSPGFAPYGLQYEPVVAFEQREHGERYLARVAEELRGRGLDVETVLSDKLGVATAIVDCAREGDHGLIVMASNGRGGLKRFVLGSVADKVVRQAHCPVLLIRPAHVPLLQTEELGLTGTAF